MDEAKWKLLPVEATPEMLVAAGKYADHCAVHNYGGAPDAEGTWDAMVEAASPAPAAVDVETMREKLMEVAGLQESNWRRHRSVVQRWAAEAATALTAAQARIRELEGALDKAEKLDREAATYVESVICMRTRFTGEPPYVGWKGLGLALREELDELDMLRAQALTHGASNDG